MDDNKNINPNENISELSDDTMAKVAGGDIHYPSDGKVYRPEDVKFVYSVGERVEIKQSILGNTKRGTITACIIADEPEGGLEPTIAYYPVYDANLDDGGSQSYIWQSHISR